jgi:hypothetical protein
MTELTPVPIETDQQEIIKQDRERYEAALQAWNALDVSKAVEQSRTRLSKLFPTVDLPVLDLSSTKSGSLNLPSAETALAAAQNQADKLRLAIKWCQSVLTDAVYQQTGVLGPEQVNELTDRYSAYTNARARQDLDAVQAAATPADLYPLFDEKDTNQEDGRRQLTTAWMAYDTIDDMLRQFMEAAEALEDAANELDHDAGNNETATTLFKTNLMHQGGTANGWQSPLESGYIINDLETYASPVRRMHENLERAVEQLADKHLENKKALVTAYVDKSGMVDRDEGVKRRQEAYDFELEEINEDRERVRAIIDQENQRLTDEGKAIEAEALAIAAARKELPPGDKQTELVLQQREQNNNNRYDKYRQDSLHFLSRVIDQAYPGQKSGMELVDNLKDGQTVEVNARIESFGSLIDRQITFHRTGDFVRISIIGYDPQLADSKVDVSLLSIPSVSSQVGAITRYVPTPREFSELSTYTYVKRSLLENRGKVREAAVNQTLSDYNDYKKHKQEQPAVAA